MRLTKKTATSLVRRHGVPHVLHGVRWKRLRSLDEALGSGASSDKRGRLSLHEHVFFLEKGLVIVLGLLHCPVSPGSCLISGWLLVTVVHVLQCGHTHCERQRRKQQPQQQPQPHLWDFVKALGGRSA